MQPQRSFADVEYDGQKRQTRRAQFLQQMDGLIPWHRLEARLRPVYPTGERGRPPYPLAMMLRIHCVQLFYNLSDPAMEDALYDSVAVQRFVGHRWPDGEHGLRVTGDRAPVVLATFEDAADEAADDRC